MAYQAFSITLVLSTAQILLKGRGGGGGGGWGYQNMDPKVEVQAW